MDLQVRIRPSSARQATIALRQIAATIDVQGITYDKWQTVRTVAGEDIGRFRIRETEED